MLMVALPCIVLAMDLGGRGGYYSMSMGVAKGIEEEAMGIILGTCEMDDKSIQEILDPLEITLAKNRVIRHRVSP